MTSITDDAISLEDLPEPALQRGYPTIAEHMSKSPENTILRRFAALNTQTLLYYQAELILLEKQLRQHEGTAAEAPSCDPQSRYARDWDWFRIIGSDGCMTPQMALTMRVRVVLREYSESPTTPNRIG